MTGKTTTIINIFDQQSEYITLKIWSNTGANFQNLFSINRTTFAYVKCLAIQFLVKKNEIENYKLIAMKSKRIMDEKKSLKEENVNDGEEYLLTRKLLSTIEQTSEFPAIDEELINIQTQDLPLSLNLCLQAHCLKRRTEFSNDLSRVLLTLIDISQKLLWYRSDAEQIFQQVEKILSKSSIEPDTDDNENEILPSLYSPNGPFIPFQQFHQQYFQPNPMAIQSLEGMGFNRNNIIEALRICHNDQNLACDYLLGDKHQQQNIINNQSLDPNSRIFKSIMKNPFIQRALNNPKIFFVLLQLYKNPNLVRIYINEPDISNLLLQISRIYRTEKYDMDTSNSNSLRIIENVN